MAEAHHPDSHPGLTMVPLDQAVAVAHSRPTPTDGHLVASGLTDEEWDAFINALSDVKGST